MKSCNVLFMGRSKLGRFIFVCLRFLLYHNISSVVLPLSREHINQQQKSHHHVFYMEASLLIKVIIVFLHSLVNSMVEARKNPPNTSTMCTVSMVANTWCIIKVLSDPYTQVSVTFRTRKSQDT